MMNIKQPEIEPGQTVRLNNTNRVYMTFKTAFRVMGFESTIQNPRKRPLQFYVGDFFKVFAIGSGERFSGYIGLQHENGDQILVERSSVTILKKSSDKPFNMYI